MSDLEAIRAQAGAARQRRRPLTEAELARVRALGSDLEGVWTAATTTHRDRKRLLRNKQGRRSGPDLPFTRSSVLSMRGRHQIPACTRKRARDDRAGPFTAEEAARELGVSMDTVHRWLRAGVTIHPSGSRAHLSERTHGRC